MGASRAGRQVSHANRADFFEGSRVPPDVLEPLPAQIATRQGKLNAGINVSVGRDVAGSVSRAAGITIQLLFSRSNRRGAEFLHIADHTFVVENLFQCGRGDTHGNNGMIAIHLRRDRRVNCDAHTQFGGQGLHSRIIARVLAHQDVGNDDSQPLRFQEANRPNGARE